MNPFYLDIEQQPQSLRRLNAFYAENQELFMALPELTKRPLLTGMGASFHAAQIATFHLNQMGVAATAVEATDLLFYGANLRQKHRPLIFVSQSGASAEVEPVMDSRMAGSVTLAITNNTESPLACQADGVLSILAGTETAPVASKTYVNSLAVLWLLARRWGGVWNGSEVKTLQRIADSCETLISQANTIVERWLDTVANSSTLLFVGHGPHAATAHQAAMMVNEWTKLPAMGMGIGTFRHGPIEITRSGLGVVIFAAPGATQASARRLAAELDENGAQVLLVEAGQTRLVSEKPAETGAVDEFLSPILDIIPAQLFTEALARHLGIDTAFRHINKVITRL